MIDAPGLTVFGADKMASRTELRGILKQNQKHSKIADERLLHHSSSNHQGKTEEEGKGRKPHNKVRDRSKIWEHSHEDCNKKSDDELVKYMSKLPSYLQSEERGREEGESFQGKILNVGVLDWKRLEKWKHGHKGGRGIESNNASFDGLSTSGSSGATTKDSHRYNISRDLEHPKKEEVGNMVNQRRHASPGKRLSFSFSRLSRSFSFKEDDSIKSSSDPKQERSMIRALLQLTIRNGHPLFQFLVDDGGNSSILGGTMRRSCSSDKDDSVRYCTFYSIEEVKEKKRGSWLTRGSTRGKQSSLAYSIIGQMRISNHYPTMESVLWEIIESKAKAISREMGAVVIKGPSGVGSTTVILPSGTHGVPSRGTLTPLIERWRSGGVCDCGGWDVGCKLRVLSNESQYSHELLKSFRLYDEERKEGKSGGFAMRRVKRGMYKVEFSSGMSSLQAFFVCITLIASGHDDDHDDDDTGDLMPKEEDDGSIKKEMKMKCSSSLNPPLSPVSRV